VAISIDTRRVCLRDGTSAAGCERSSAVAVGRRRGGCRRKTSGCRTKLPGLGEALSPCRPAHNVEIEDMQVFQGHVRTAWCWRDRRRRRYICRRVTRRAAIAAWSDVSGLARWSADHRPQSEGPAARGHEHELLAVCENAAWSSYAGMSVERSRPVAVGLYAVEIGGAVASRR